MKKVIKLFVGAFCAVSLVTSTFAANTNTVATVKAPVQNAQDETWTLSVGGSGGTTTSGESQSVFGANIALGHTGHLILPLEAGVRQGFGYDSVNGGSTVLDTHLFSDWTVLTIDKLDVFAGASAGLSYGNIPCTWTLAPEAGVRYWIKNDVAIVGRVDYPFDLNKGRSEETLRYFVGVRINLGK